MKARKRQSKVFKEGIIDAVKSGKYTDFEQTVKSRMQSIFKSKLEERGYKDAYMRAVGEA